MGVILCRVHLVFGQQGLLDIDSAEMSVRGAME